MWSEQVHEGLWDAARYEKHEEVERLLDEGANPNWLQPVFEWTALHRAASGGHPEIVRTLLARGAELEKRDFNGSTALHHAVGGDQESTVQVLIEAGANVHAETEDGRTPLHFSKSTAVVEALVGAGANVAATDKDQRTPLHRVCYFDRGLKGTITALVAAGADVHTRDKDGETALHIAAKKGFPFYRIDELVAAGADLDCTNNAGKTPRDVATPKARLALDRARLAREQFEVQVPPDRVMLMFCGNGLVGKTTLTKAIEHMKVDPAHPVDGRTYGFDSFSAVIPHAGECTMVDFGGQPEFWVPHGTFLGNRSGVYLVVVNLGDPPATQHSQLRHWLRFIVSRSEGDTRPQVAVVGSHRGAAQSINTLLKEEGHAMMPDEREELILRLKQLKSIQLVGQRRVCSTLQDTTQRFQDEFAEALDIGPSPFLIESVNPDAMDTAELTRLQLWLHTAFDHVRDTRKVPQVCLQVADLVASRLRPTLPPISTYDTVMAALKEAAGDSIDFSDDSRNRAILSHLWEAGHLMVFEGVGDTVVLDAQAFGTHVIGQLFCPHGDPDFRSLVVNEKDCFVFRKTQLEAHLAGVRARGCDFGDVTLALKLLTALELIIPLPTTPDTVGDPVFAIPGRLNQGDAVLEKYRRRPAECWSEPRHFDGWVYLGVRLMLASPLSLIPPSEFPRLQHRLSKKLGFRMWRHGLCVRRCTPRGLIEVEGLIELDLTLEHIDVCVRSEVGAEEACVAELTELVEACQRVSPHFECGMLTSESLKKHVDTERVVADGVGPELGGGAMGVRVEITAAATNPSALESASVGAPAPAASRRERKRRKVDTVAVYDDPGTDAQMQVDGEAGPAPRQDALRPVEWLVATLGTSSDVTDSVGPLAPDVLISYSTKVDPDSAADERGKLLTLHIASLLGTHGISCYHGLMVPPGDEWWHHWFGRVAGSKVAIVVLSSGYFASAQCIRELNALLGHKMEHRIIPVVAGAGVPEAMQGDFLGTTERGRLQAAGIRALFRTNWLPPPDEAGGIFKLDCPRSSALLIETVQAKLRELQP